MRFIVGMSKPYKVSYLNKDKEKCSAVVEAISPRDAIVVFKAMYRPTLNGYTDVKLETSFNNEPVRTTTEEPKNI